MSIYAIQSAVNMIPSEIWEDIFFVLEHAGELRIIVLLRRKKGNPYKTPHTQKEATNHLRTKKRKWYDHNLNNTQTLHRWLSEKVKNTFSPSQTP